MRARLINHITQDPADELEAIALRDALREGEPLRRDVVPGGPAVVVCDIMGMCAGEMIWGLISWGWHHRNPPATRPTWATVQQLRRRFVLRRALVEYRALFPTIDDAGRPAMAAAICDHWQNVSTPEFTFCLVTLDGAGPLLLAGERRQAWVAGSYADADAVLGAKIMPWEKPAGVEPAWRMMDQRPAPGWWGK